MCVRTKINSLYMSPCPDHYILFISLFVSVSGNALLHRVISTFLVDSLRRENISMTSLYGGPRGGGS